MVANVKTSIGTVVAERVLQFQPLDGDPRPVSVRLGFPRPDPDDARTWLCPSEITGMGRTQRHRSFGVDAFQALSLALHRLPWRLKTLARRAGGGVYTFFGSSDILLVDGC